MAARTPEKDEDPSLCQKEHRWLRQELHDLKECQVRYIFYTVIATGALLGLAGSDNLGDSLRTLAPLLPLAIVLPFWWVFFDKAKVITRAVGYYRLLEEEMIAPTSRLFGYERSLKEFRRMQDRGALEDPKLKDFNWWESLVQLLRLRTSHTYWVLVYWVFLVLSVLCLVMSLLMRVEGNAWWGFGLAAILVALSTVCNWKIMWRLIYGRHSYDANEGFWREVLKRMKDLQRWTKVSLRMGTGLGVSWPTDARQVQRQDDVLRNVVQPVLAGRDLE